MQIQNNLSVQPEQIQLNSESTEVESHIEEAASAHQQPQENQTNQSNMLPALSFNSHLDSEEQFLLSCAPALKRLSQRKNALARLKIQQILFNIEFGETDIDN